MGAWVAAVAARPRRALAGVALVLVLALAGVLRLGIDTDSSRMLAGDLPFRERADALDAAFPRLDETIVVAVRSDIPDAADAATAALARALARRGDSFRFVFAPAADPYLVAHGLLYLDRAALEARLARLGRSANLLATLRAEPSLPGFLRALDGAAGLAAQAPGGAAMLEPLYAEAAAVLAAERRGQDRPFGWSGVLGGAGRDGTAIRTINLGPRLDFSALQPAGEALAVIGRAIKGLDPDLAGAVEIGVTGDLALRAEELDSVVRRLPLSLALSVVLAGLLLHRALGSAARAGLALGTLAVTLVATAGFAGAAVGALNLVSIAFVVLMVGLGIDYAIHFIARFDEHRVEVSSRRVALVRSGRALGPALVLSAATTALAFLAFTTTDFAGMAQLGLIGAAGVLIALASTLTVIPASVTLWPGLDAGPLPRPLRQPPPAIGRALPWLALALGLGGLALAPGARFDADPMNLRDPDAASVRTHDWLAADPELTPMRLSLLVGDAGAARAAAARLEALDEVREARWLADLVPRDQQAKLELIDLAYPSILHAVEGPPAVLGEGGAVTPESLAARLAGQPGPGAAALARELSAYAGRRSPERDEALAGNIFRHFPMLIDRLGRQLEAKEVTPETLPEPLRARYVAADGRLRVEIVPAADIRAPGPRAAFVEAVAAVAPGAAGPSDMMHGAARAVGRAMLEATLLALVGCTLLGWAMLRDAARVGAILLPLFLAAAVTVGAGVLLGLPFNYANVLVLPLLIGLGIDSGVHVALRASRMSGSVFGTSTPRAVLYSALTTVAAFGTLGLSHHPGTASMGILLAIAVLAAVFMTFNLTPALIRAIRRRPGPPLAGP
ncbi:MAG TPA: MMPL family transporter [Thermohalobaculum sp.]|nr:MMPL family transporter [Thermohalobaculum sp.]